MNGCVNGVYTMLCVVNGVYTMLCVVNVCVLGKQHMEVLENF